MESQSKLKDSAPADISEAFESFFKAIQITDATTIVGYFLKNFCETEQSTNDNINRFIFVLKIKSEQIKSSSSQSETLKSDVELYKKSLIILGTLSRYVKHSNSFSVYIKDIVENLFLPHFLESFDEDMKFEVLRSYTSLLQIYEDTIESYSAQFIQHLVTIDINRSGFPQSSIKSIIDFMVIIMQASPLLVINNIKLIESLIKIYCLKEDETIYEDLTQVLGQFFQLYLPYKSSIIESTNDDDSDDESDDEDESSMVDSNKLKVSAMGLENTVNINLLESLANQLIENINKESSSISLGILCGYSSIYIKDKSLSNYIFNYYLSMIKKDNICNKENRKVTVSIINSLRIGVSNTCIRCSEECQTILIETFKTLLECIGDIREYVKSNLTKGTQVFFQRIRSSIILNLISIIRIIKDSFQYAEEFLIYAPVLADPIIFSEFIISLNRNLNHLQQQQQQQKQDKESIEYNEKKSLIQEIYLPKVLNPLLGEIVKPVQKYKSMTIHIIQAIGNIALSSQLLYQPFIETTIERLSQFVVKNWKSISKYAPSCIVTLDKLMQLLVHDELYKSQYLDTIILSVYMKLLNSSKSIQLDETIDDEDEDVEEDDDDAEEDENGKKKKKNIDSDIISKIMFTILECLTNTIPKISKRLIDMENQSVGKNIAKEIYKYLMSQIGVEEVIFDADRYIRLAQLDLLNEIYCHCLPCLPKSNHITISIKHIFNEMLQIQLALELGEEEVDRNGHSQRKDICLNAFKSIINNSILDKQSCSEQLKELINSNQTSNDIDKHQVKKELLELFK
ncbi:hypothetical protein RB653_003858 [Dictyostelium firmibasis]|uniref:Uncharacterized protein n=1 Tax=Dictyostelium firmibasis TaxID=79012 RepID=A0AAN7Z2V7_9MYCE